MQFKQKPWLKKYIDFNIEKRKDASLPFEKDFFKLMNNAVHRKTLQNVRKRRDVVLVNTDEKVKKLAPSPNFLYIKDFGGNFVCIQRLKKKIGLNRPIYTEFVVLELRKLLMYKFNYNYIRKLHGNNAKFLFTDTDSLTYEIETNDVYEDMKTNASLFDTSEYPKSHLLHCEKNKKNNR